MKPGLSAGLEKLEALAAKHGVNWQSREFAQLMDSVDPLAQYRSEFHFPVEHGTDMPYRYFCGNSLGLQHRDVESYVVSEVKKWREQGVEGHFLQPNPWFEIDDVLRDDMARIVGALPSEVVIMSSLTVNLHLLLSAFYQPEGTRRKILCENNPFPSDTHALVSQLLNHNCNADTDLIMVKPAPGDGEIISTAQFIKAIEENKDSLALVLVAGVHFLTGQFFDLKSIAEAAHKHGIPFGVDLAHAVGNLPLQLHDWDVDFACWCTYKYLNGGPGNIGGLFVHERHTNSDLSPAASPAFVPPVATSPVSEGGVTPTTTSEKPKPFVFQPKVLKGWWGHQRTNRFHLGTDFFPSPGAAVFQLSNPCVLSIMSLAPSVKLCASVGMDKLRKKSLLLTGYLEQLLVAKLSFALEIVTPTDEEQRGCQLSARIKPQRVKSKILPGGLYANGTDVPSDALVVQKQLLDRGVICDNRPPDILRLSPVPMYNSFEDVFVLVDKLSTLFVESDPLAVESS
jgi:kynureninase